MKLSSSYCKVCGQHRRAKGVDHSACSKLMQDERRKLKVRPCRKTLTHHNIDYMTKLDHDTR